MNTKKFNDIYSPILWYHGYYSSVYSRPLSINVRRHIFSLVMKTPYVPDILHTKLNKTSITGRHIMKVSGHRSETSLKSYSNRVSVRKKGEISSNLSDAISSSKSTKTSTMTKSATEEQPIPSEELLDLFTNDIELEEVDENLMSDPQLNNIMLGMSTDSSNANENPITLETQGNCVNLQMNRTCNNLNQILKSVVREESFLLCLNLTDVLLTLLLIIIKRSKVKLIHGHSF